MSMDDRDGVIWMDGEMVPWRDAKVHVLTHTLHYGMGVFEGVRAYKAKKGTAIFRLEEHTKRLFRSAHIMKMPMPFDQDTINEIEKKSIELTAMLENLSYQERTNGIVVIISTVFLAVVIFLIFSLFINIRNKTRLKVTVSIVS